MAQIGLSRLEELLSQQFQGMSTDPANLLHETGLDVATMKARWIDPLLLGLRQTLSRRGTPTMDVEEGHIPALVVWPRTLARRIKQVRVNSVPGRLTFGLAELRDAFTHDQPYLCLDVSAGTEVIGYPFDGALNIASLNGSLCTASEGIDLARLQPHHLWNHDMVLGASRAADGSYPVLRIRQNTPTLELVPKAVIEAMDHRRVRLGVASCWRRIFPPAA